MKGEIRMDKMDIIQIILSMVLIGLATYIGGMPLAMAFN